MFFPVLGPRANQVVVIKVVVGVRTKLPVRLRECLVRGVEGARPQAGLPRIRWFTNSALKTFGAVEVRPTRRVVCVDQVSIQGPTRLIDTDILMIDENDIGKIVTSRAQCTHMKL